MAFPSPLNAKYKTKIGCIFSFASNDNWTPHCNLGDLKRTWNPDSPSPFVLEFWWNGERKDLVPRMKE